MALFDSLLLLLLFAIALLQVSRKVAIPYPTMLALAGVLVAALPWTPGISLDPRLALALFISPAILDAAFDLPPRSVRRDWVPLLSLAVIAVLITTVAVAWTAVRFAGMPVAAAVALGAIVAPPDAAAASGDARALRAAPAHGRRRTCGSRISCPCSRWRCRAGCSSDSSPPR